MNVDDMMKKQTDKDVEIKELKAEVERLKASRDAYADRAALMEAKLERAEYKLACITGVGL